MEEDRLVEVEVECEEDEDNLLFSYKQLVDDSNLFYRQLSLFHSSSTSPSLSVSLGGSLLDLHRLFVQVTSRGGLLQVIKDRKWKNVVSAFEFPTSEISTSFVLRKYYVALLYHFEHLYFFRNTTLLSSSTDNANPLPHSTTSTHHPGTPQIPPGVSFVGVIDEKFDNGYVVSVNLGSDHLRGILYHIPHTPQPSSTSNPHSSLSPKPKMSDPNLIGKPDDFPTGRYSTLTPISHEQEHHVTKTVKHLWNISPLTK